MNKRSVSAVLLLLMPLLLLSACVGLIVSADKPLRHQAAIEGEPDMLARCAMRALSADSRPSMRLYHYKLQIYPDIPAAQIFAYDTRFLPYIYSSNSPQNPDGIRDYIGSPEILRGVREVEEARYGYGFVLTITQTDHASSHAAVKGDPFVSGIAWNYLLACAAASNRL
ncbi:hypothetical protein [Nitrosomonas sp.]|uniref:hypothetical protein n=1 Tax=Nitrosomonas sp. TaxID=42353 RepID=UPI0028450471|nr:hypothetical protein [Nitrosomonas sp.]MCP5292442.1 hypothetical protein [Burkholderiales bacterium]MDR4515665.1 hypothetical protein [Nitrosomonas sp.]